MIHICLAKTRKNALVAFGNKSSLAVLFVIKSKAKSCAVVNIRKAIISEIPDLKSQVIDSFLQMLGNVDQIIYLIVRIVGILPEGNKLAVDINAVIIVSTDRQNDSICSRVFKRNKKFSVLVGGIVGTVPYPRSACKL